jgi:iron(III) transport system substrate-binding protein
MRNRPGITSRFRTRVPLALPVRVPHMIRTGEASGTQDRRFRPARRKVLGALAALTVGAAAARPAGTVVVYSALDREFAEPILRAYGQAAGVRVLPKFDVESTKTVGLTNLIAAEAARPRCDLFWNNEILNTLRLRRAGLLQPFHPAGAAGYPASFHDREGYWYGFAARARILAVNTELVPEARRPRGLLDLLDPRWKGKVAIAKPLFGTTATHATCLFAAWGPEKARAFFQALKANGVQVLSGNKQVAQAVSAGTAAFGLTDTDDAMGERDAGRPLALVYPDRAAGELGTLFIPNTLAVVKGAPHAAEAEALASHLLSPAVETTLARGPSAQIPLNPAVTAPPRVETPKTVRAMTVDWNAAVARWDQTAAFLTGLFAG